MTTTTLSFTTHPNIGKKHYSEELTGKIAIARNMSGNQPRESGKFVDPTRTRQNPSPMKKSSANRQPGQSHTRAPAINYELAKARIVMDDLADHIFGHIVSTELAKGILRNFIADGAIEIFDGKILQSNLRFSDKEALDPNSDDVQSAIQQAFEDAVTQECKQRNGKNNSSESRTSTADFKGKGKQKSKTYTFKWTSYPKEPIQEDDMVDFLDEITDKVLDFAKPKLSNADASWRHRFAAPIDKKHAFPLSYELDGEGCMRLDFVLLPREAFTDGDFKTVDPKYINFTASQPVGEVKNKDLAAGLEQVHRYARGLKCAQPWIRYVLAMMITKGKAVLLRGDSSGTEHLELVLTNGRGCIEFIRILFGLVLADGVDLGQNPCVELKCEERKCEVGKTIQPSTTVNTSVLRETSGQAATSTDMGSHDVLVPDFALSEGATEVGKNRSCLGHGRAVARRPGVTYADSRLHQSHWPAPCVTLSSCFVECLPRLRKGIVLGSELIMQCLFLQRESESTKTKLTTGITSSIRGRGTTVFCVLDLKRIKVQDEVMEVLKNNLHKNVIVPSYRTVVVERDGEALTTLRGIRAFLDEDEKLLIENRALTLSLSVLKRPVKFFWGVHDFVRGLRGALLGHQYLTEIGILHRDISENNIALARRPGEERGYLIDFDMAILQEAELPTPRSLRNRIAEDEDLFGLSDCQENVRPLEVDKTVPVKALRTVTFPYMSYNVLLGNKHTHFDDVESFLYVLFFFFFSYQGPLSKAQLLKADQNEFVYFGCLPHLTKWPKQYANWANGDAEEIAALKHFIIVAPNGSQRIVEDAEFQDCLENNWPKALHSMIKLLVRVSFSLFRRSTLDKDIKEPHTEVSHAEFINILEQWLERSSHLEDEFSSCPKFE